MKHRIEAREEWLAAREALLVREKEHTRLADELAQQRRERPWLPLEKEYRSETEDGTRTLAELFDGLAAHRCGSKLAADFRGGRRLNSQNINPLKGEPQWEES